MAQCPHPVRADTAGCDRARQHVTRFRKSVCFVGRNTADRLLRPTAKRVSVCMVVTELGANGCPLAPCGSRSTARRCLPPQGRAPRSARRRGSWRTRRRHGSAARQERAGAVRLIQPRQPLLGPARLIDEIPDLELEAHCLRRAPPGSGGRHANRQIRSARLFAMTGAGRCRP